MKTLQNIITVLELLFALTCLVYLTIHLIKTKTDIKYIIVTVFLAFAVFGILPLILHVYAFVGLVFTGYLIVKKVIKPKEKINTAILNDDNSFYLDSENGVIQIANPYRGLIVEGGAGSGKSKSIFYPIIQQLFQKYYAGVLYDFKSPELSQFAHAMHKKSGSKINFSFLNFKDYSNSDRINPLSPKYVKSQAIAFEISTVLVSNLLPESIKRPDYWSRSCISIIAGVIWYLHNNHPDKCTLPHLIAMMLNYSASTLIEVISQDLECVGMISSIKEAHEMKAEKQLSGVLGTIKNALSQLNFPELFYLLSFDGVDLDINNPNNPTFLCIGNDSTLSNTYAPIISLVMSVCLRKMNEPNKIKSAVLLDEAPTLYIPNLEQLPATARSNKICTIVGLQDYSQMVDKYGQDKAQVLMSNLGNQFYGRTVNERTAKMISGLFGNEDKEYQSSSISKGQTSGGDSSSSSSTSKSIQQRDRVKVSDITNLPAGKFYGLIAEGNYNELLGVQLHQVEAEYEPFETKDSPNVSYVFKTIYNDVKMFLETKNVEPKDEFNIDLN